MTDRVHLDLVRPLLISVSQGVVKFEEISRNFQLRRLLEVHPLRGLEGRGLKMPEPLRSLSVSHSESLGINVSRILESLRWDPLRSITVFTQNCRLRPPRKS